MIIGAIEYNTNGKVIVRNLVKELAPSVKDALDCPKNSFLNCQLF